MAGRFTVSAVFKAIDRWSKPIGKMRKATLRMTKRVGKGLKKIDKGFSAVTRGIKRAGVAITAFALAAGTAIKSVVGTGAEFEQAITNVGAVGLKSRDQIAALEKQALSLGESTKFTATEVAGAMEIMAKAGFKTEEILAGVPGVLDAAAASGSEIAEVADVVSSSLKGMGLATTEASRVSDVLALASSKTNSTIVSLGESMKNVASTARQLKVPFEDAVAGVALLQDVGLDASVAGSALNVMLTKLAKPPAAVAKQMKKFGISFKDAEGNMLPFQKVISNISEAAKKSGGNLDQVAFLADLVGLRGQKAASNLAKLFETGKLQELTEQLKNAEGTAAKMAALRMDTLTGDILKLEAATDGVKIALFNLEGGPLRGVIQGITEWIGANKGLIVSGVSEFIADLTEAMPEIVKWTKRIGRGLAVFFTLAAAVKVASAAVAVFNFLIALSPLGALAIAIVALGALFVIFWDEVVVLTRNAWTNMASFWTGAFDSLKSGLVAIGDFIIGFFEFLFPGISSMVVTMVKTVIDGWTQAFQFLATMFSDTVTVMGEFATQLIDAFEPVRAFFVELWSSIATGFKIIVEPILGVISNAVKDISGLVGIGRGTRESAATNRRGFAPSAAPQVVSPQERISREVSESISETNQSMSMVIKDESGRAQILSKPRNMSVELQQSGAT